VDVKTSIYVIPDSRVRDVFLKKHNNSPVSDEEIDRVESVAVKAIKNDASICCAIQ